MLQRVLDNIYKIDVPMRDGALNCLNAYFIQGERNLLIDTGFDREESYKTITGALNRLETSMENTDIFPPIFTPTMPNWRGGLPE